MDVVGILKRVEAIKESGANGFKSRDVIVTTEEQYPQTLSIQFVQDKVNEMDIFKPGEKVKIAINLKGKEYTKDEKTIVFNTIQGWRIEKAI